MSLMLIRRIKDAVESGSSGLEAIKTKVDQVYSRVGAPAGASIAADIAAIKSQTAALEAFVDPELADALANTAAIFVAVDTEVGDILADTAVIGAPAGASISADIAAVKAETASILADTAVIGAPAGASISADIAAVKAAVDAVDDFVDTEVAAIKTSTDKIGNPAGASLAADIASVKTDTSNTLRIEPLTVQSVVPSLANGTLVTGGVGAWAQGSFAEVAASIVGGAGGSRIRAVNVEALTATAIGELELFRGAIASEVSIGKLRFAATGSYRFESEVLPANVRISAKFATKVGGAQTCEVSVAYVNVA